MKRKRFIKLLMSRGYSRDEAEAEAIEVQLSARPCSYAERYSYMQKCGILWMTKYSRDLWRGFKGFRRQARSVARRVKAGIRSCAGGTP